MRNKWIIGIPILVFVLVLFILIPMQETQVNERLDTTEVNRLVKECGLNWDELERSGIKPLPDTSLIYAVIDHEGNVLGAAGEKAPQSVNEAIAGRDTIVDINKEGKAVGKVLIYNDASDRAKTQNRQMLMTAAAAMLVMLITVIGFLVYLNSHILKPFQKLRDFAVKVAAGNLDYPLKMDKDNAFGAFTESFDLMREELKKAREQERQAHQSKKELVAQLSHDIKTPVASIKVVAELMEVRTEGEKEKEQLKVIESKADQIDKLVSNLFHATLEELEELSVAATEQSTLPIQEMLASADYQGLARIPEIPRCLVWFDEMRLRQVFDNLIENSYKYAGTPIEIACREEADFLEIEISDHGNSLSDEERALVTGKFYRGKNAEGKSGTGLGLYISRYLMEQMGGELRVCKPGHGFAVIVRLRMAGTSVVKQN